MRSVFLLLVTLALTAFQTGEIKLISGIPFESAVFLTVDAFGNSYVIADRQVMKFNAYGKPIQHFGNSKLGELRSVDATNPMKVLLFYPDMAQLVILGTQFAPQSTLELRNIGINQPTVACNSNNEGYWVYDLQDFQLKKINRNLDIVFQSGNLVQLIGKQILPNFMTESDQKVYLNDPQQGVLVFDQFGSYLRTLPVKGLQYFRIVKNELIYTDGAVVKAMDLKLLTEHELLLPPHGKIRTVEVATQQLYLLTNDSLNIYSY